MSGGRQRRRIAVLLAAALLLSGCGSDGPDFDPDVLELDDLEAIEPAPDPEPEPVDDEPEPEPVDDAPSEGEPAGELDGVIPESAFEINDDLDADEAAQRELLRVYAEAIALINAALAGEPVDEADLAEVLSPDELRGVLASVDDQQERGEVQVLTDSTTRFVRIEQIDGAGARVAQCLEHGAGSGVFDVASGEKVLDMPTTEFFVDHLALLVDDDQRVRWVIDGGTVAEDERCA